MLRNKKEIFNMYKIIETCVETQKESGVKVAVLA